MRKLLIIATAIMLLRLPGVAQSERVEVFGGYSLFVVSADDLRRFGPVLPRIGAPIPGRQLFNGWDAEVSLHLTPLLSLVGDVSGHYQSVTVVEISKFGNVPDLDIDVKSQMYNFLAGPRVSFKAGLARPFAHALFGLSRTTSHSNVRDNSFVLPEVQDNNFALAIGGGLDFPIASSVSIRPIKLDYMLLKTDPNALNAFILAPSPSKTNNLRYSAGVVFRF